MRPATLIVLSILCVAADARACSVPVFRYALERWKPARYPAHVFHRGPLSEAQKATLAKLDVPANLDVTAVDLDEADADALALWKRHGKEDALPFVVVRYPDAEMDQPPLWSGKLDKTLAPLLDSPARREVVKGLTRGDSVVWVLMLSGDEKADETAAKLLDKELARLQQEITLPEQADDVESMLLTAVPLKVAFSVVRLDRTRPEEAVFVRTLLDSDADLDKANGPIALPIFGRGRALVGLEGESLTARQIEAAAKFLCGACSCRVKELNPGMDLLMAADWDDLIGGKAEEPAKEGATEPTAPTIPPGKKVVPIEPATSSSNYLPECQPCRLTLYAGVGGGGVLALLCGAWLLYRRRATEHPNPFAPDADGPADFHDNN